MQIGAFTLPISTSHFHGLDDGLSASDGAVLGNMGARDEEAPLDDRSQDTSMEHYSDYEGSEEEEAAARRSAPDDDDEMDDDEVEEQKSAMNVDAATGDEKLTQEQLIHEKVEHRRIEMVWFGGINQNLSDCVFHVTLTLKFKN